MMTHHGQEERGRRKEEENKRKKKEKEEKTSCVMLNARSLDGDELEGLRVACRLGREVSPRGLKEGATFERH